MHWKWNAWRAKEQGIGFPVLHWVHPHRRAVPECFGRSGWHETGCHVAKEGQTKKSDVHVACIAVSLTTLAATATIKSMV